MEAYRQIWKNENEVVGRKSNLVNNLLTVNGIRFFLKKPSLYFLIQSAMLAGDKKRLCPISFPYR